MYNIDIKETFTQPLLPSSLDNSANNGVADNKPSSDVIAVISYATNNMLVAVHLIGNSLMFSFLGPNAEAAGSLVSSIQNVITASVGGILMSTGTQLGIVLGKRDSRMSTRDKYDIEAIQLEAELDESIGSIIKSSWLIGGTLGIISTACFLLTRPVMPYVVAPATGKAVADFFYTFAIGGFTEALIMNNGIIVAQIEKNNLLPLLFVIAYRLPAVALGYYFSIEHKMGPAGLGLGTALSGLGSFAISQFYLAIRKPYQKYKLLNCFSIPNFGKYFYPFMSDGWKLALQRLSEWGNIMAISTVIGSWNNSSLEALEPALQANTLIGLGLNGMTVAALMFITRDCTAKQEHYKKFKLTLNEVELEQFYRLSCASKADFYKNNIIGLLLASSLGTAIYFARHPIANLLLKSTATLEQTQLAMEMLEYNLLALLPDAIRVVSGGVLRGWGELLFPTLSNILVMTVLGVSVAAGLSYYEFDENPLVFFWARIVGIAISAGINCHCFWKRLKDDEQLYWYGKDVLSIQKIINVWENTDNLIAPIPTRNLSDILTNTGLTLIDNPGKNSGFFTAIAQSIEGGFSEKEIKKTTIEEIVNSINNYHQQKKNQFIDNFSKNQMFATKTILKTLANAFAINIVLITNKSTSIHVTKSTEVTNRTIYVAYDTKGKYYALSGKPKKQLTDFIYEGKRRQSFQAAAIQAPASFWHKSTTETGATTHSLPNLNNVTHTALSKSW